MKFNLDIEASGVSRVKGLQAKDNPHNNRIFVIFGAEPGNY